MIGKMNESVTDDIISDFFKGNDFYKEDKVSIGKQSSSSIKIDKLLKNASKGGSGKGFPDFIIQYKKNSEFIVVIESKPDSIKHISEKLDKYKEYAVDGVKLYSSFLSKEYDVLSIAVSGNNINNLRISHYLQLKNTEKAQPIFNDDQLLSLEEYEEGYKKDERKFNQDFQELKKYSKTLNENLHSLKVKENERSLLISGMLIALTDKSFCNSYRFKTPQSLSNFLVNTIEEKLTNIQNENVKDIISTYSFIKTHTILAKKENKLRDIISEIDNRINNFIKTYKFFDTLGQFYIEFLKYANNDSGLGIVLTPPHITELFCEIANVNKDSVLLDTCAGTGGFLISAMRKMILDAGNDKKKEKNIKDKQIIGIEIQHDIFSLVCSNMYIHGDGRSNLIKGDCFDSLVMSKISKYKPNVGFLNPPYKVKNNDTNELDFVLNNLKQLEKGSLCVVIIPMSCVLANSGKEVELKKQLLKNHTLEAVFSMHSEVFYNSKVTVATCIVIIRAKEKHPIEYKTYFAMWQNDGFIKIKKIGRTDFNNNWESIKSNWVKHYQNKEEIIGYSIKEVVRFNDEWVAEKYIKLDYSTTKYKHFKAVLISYVGNLFLLNKIDSITKKSKYKNKLDLESKVFESFNLTGEKGIFDIEKGERLNKGKRGFGETPLLTSTSLQNGISSFIDSDSFRSQKKLFKNKITIDMLSNVFYHGYDYFSDDNVHTLILKKKYEEFENDFVAIFITTLLKNISIRYNYGRQVRLKRLQNEIIALPVDNNEEPDWKFMEDYIKSLPYSANL